MSLRRTSRLIAGIVVLIAATGAGAIAPAGAAAAGAASTCDASALRLSVLGQTPIEPITANHGASTCRNDQAGIAPVTVGPLTAGAVFAQTTGAASSHVHSSGGVATLSVATGSLLPFGSLPTGQAINALPSVSVPISAAGQLAGLPATVLVDIRPAVSALVPSTAPPTLLDVNGLVASADARCQGGAATVSASSSVLGISVLGQTLPIDGVANQALNVFQGQTIQPSALDPNKVVLPGGLSLSNPITGTLLSAALSQALAALPPITLPASTVSVTTTAGEQSTDAAGVLTRRALHVKIGLLGQPLLDAVVGEARMSAGAATCSMSAGQVISSAALQCSDRRVTLIDVLDKGDHVALYGAANRALVGRRVDIVFNPTRRVVASPRVRPDGTFVARAKVPPQSIRLTNAARYFARIGADHSLNLKLHRRMIVGRTRSSHGRIRVSGYVVRPLTVPAAPVVLTQRISCKAQKVVARLKPDRFGRFSVLLHAPPKGLAAVYRASSAVLHTRNNPKRFRTWTLPRFVAINR